ncbi:MAG: PaaI family thioesterase [Thermodesulfobacteriota bacterium]|nr:PaaI family thioesterase [Thermodesulfobacteriota bacterium]
MDNDLIKNVKNDKFAAFVGIRLVKVSPGYALTELELNENHLNGVNMVQGGVIFTLADYAFAAACNAAGCPTIGLSTTISYYRPPTGRKIKAEAKEISVEKKISGYQVNVMDEDNTVVAAFTGLGYRKHKQKT